MIEERKTGLAAYLNAILVHPTYRNAPALSDFLSSNDSKTSNPKLDPEDALPSTMSRQSALQIKAQLLSGDGEATANKGEMKADATLIAAAYYPGRSTCMSLESDLSF